MRYFLVFLFLTGCTSASYKKGDVEVTYKSLFKSAGAVSFVHEDGTSISVTDSRSDIQAISDIVKALSP